MGPVGFLAGDSWRALRDLLVARLDALGLQDEPDGLATAMRAASGEIATILAPALRRADIAARAA